MISMTSSSGPSKGDRAPQEILTHVIQPMLALPWILLLVMLYGQNNWFSNHLNCFQLMQRSGSTLSFNWILDLLALYPKATSSHTVEETRWCSPYYVSFPQLKTKGHVHWWSMKLTVTLQRIPKDSITSSDARTRMYHQHCFLESLGVSGPSLSQPQELYFPLCSFYVKPLPGSTHVSFV